MKKTLASLAVAACLFAGANAFAQTEKPTSNSPLTFPPRKRH
ncbi:hypothetical protein [Pseudomonas sp. W4I3]|nr:hypothetical protein [Pseudomonas sp. W4I3]MDQ0740413.1 hypothetical protein [Pseudomonas sp. W4I3]